jgi:hypothetical protein
MDVKDGMVLLILETFILLLFPIIVSCPPQSPHYDLNPTQVVCTPLFSLPSTPTPPIPPFTYSSSPNHSSRVTPITSTIKHTMLLPLSLIHFICLFASDVLLLLLQLFLVYRYTLQLQLPQLSCSEPEFLSS